MLIDFFGGQTGLVLRVRIFRSDVSTGAGLTGLTSASTGLRISTIADNEATATAYTAAGSKIETIVTLGTYAAPTATKVRFREVDATNHQGLYEVQVDDARVFPLPVGGRQPRYLILTISGAANAAECYALIPLRSYQPYVEGQADNSLVRKSDLASQLQDSLPENMANLIIGDDGKVVASDVSGDVQGKVLGGGSGTIAGVGAWVLGETGTALLATVIDGRTFAQWLVHAGAPRQG
jgi:hypothetical protein